VSLSAYVTDHKLHVSWDLKSDAGLQLGGWALDDVCIVANPQSICGDGIKQTYEFCDNGPANADIPDACRTDCQLPKCGDAIVDTGEQCDNGSANANVAGACRTNCQLPTCGDKVVDSGEECDDGPNGSQYCTAECHVAWWNSIGSGGCSASGDRTSSLALGAMLAGLLARRRATRYGRTRAPRSPAR